MLIQEHCAVPPENFQRGLEDWEAHRWNLLLIQTLSLFGHEQSFSFFRLTGAVSVPQVVAMFLLVCSGVHDKKGRIARNKKKVPPNERDQRTPRSPDVKRC